MDNGRVLQEYTQQSFISLDTKSYQTLNLRQRSTPQLRPIKSAQITRMDLLLETIHLIRKIFA